MGRFDAVIFDMDGTLIEQRLDFACIRQGLGIGDGRGILESIAEMPPPKQDEAARRLLAYELAAARQATLIDGAAETLAAIRSAGLKTALLTRNARCVMDMVLAKFNLTFDLAWSRELGLLKPQPDGVVRACQALGAKPERTACVGDFRYDIQAANRAGAVSVLLGHHGRCDLADQADYVIGGLPDLLNVLEL